MDKPVVKNFTSLTVDVPFWYHDAEGNQRMSQSNCKNVEQARAFCNKVVAGNVRTYDGNFVEACEFEGKRFESKRKYTKTVGRQITDEF